MDEYGNILLFLLSAISLSYVFIKLVRLVPHNNVLMEVGGVGILSQYLH